MDGHLGADVDLSALFGIEMVSEAGAVSAPAIADAVCGKCKGRGNFIGYSGRIVGKCFTCDGTGLRPATAPGADINVARIAEAFATAFGNGVKRPKLRLEAFQFSRAPDTGRNAGSIYVKEGEAYLGKVADGKFQPSRDCDAPTAARVVTVASDPFGAAKAHGLKTGQCSCCGRELTNGESIELGIGPICRDKFGWG